MGRHHSRSRSRSRSHSRPEIETHQNSPYSHIFCLASILISTIFLFLVILYNVPFSTSDVGNGLNNRMWLVTLKLVSKGSEYGFGVWGWCSWSLNTNIAGGRMQDGWCKKKAFWKLPDDFDRGDNVGGVDLHSEISKSLTISAFFLIFVLYSSLSLLLALILTLRFHSHDQPSTNGRIYWLPNDKYVFRTWLAHNLRNYYLRVMTMIIISAWGLPVLLIAGIGVGKIANDYKNVEGVEVTLGTGWWMTISALVLLMLVQITIPLAGLWNNAKRSGKRR